MRFRVVVDDLADFVNVAGGYFMPPSFNSGNGRVDPFYIGKYEVQWGEFRTVRDWGVANKGYDLVDIGSGASGSHPVTDLNLFQVLKWCNARSEMEGKMPVYTVDGLIYRTGDRFPGVNPSANGYRLPTRLEWEWAAEGGNQEVIYTYSGGDDISVVAWYAGNSGGGVHVVGGRRPNDLGIFDMSGNVWEMSYDFGSGYPSFSSNGGGWNDAAPFCARAGLRESGFYSPYDVASDLGFRLALSQF
jgi:formylglycine-generating enzyme required for sulfatase activity